MALLLYKRDDIAILRYLTEHPLTNGTKYNLILPNLTCGPYKQSGPSQQSLQNPAPYILLREPCDLFRDLFVDVALTCFHWGQRPNTSPKTNRRAFSKECMGMDCAHSVGWGHFAYTRNCCILPRHRFTLYNGSQLHQKEKKIPIDVTALFDITASTFQVV